MTTLSFTVTEDHIKLVKSFYIDWDDRLAGAPVVDPKRPYGNKSVEHDIAAILGWTIPDEESPEWGQFAKKCQQIHRETKVALQILTCNADKGIQPGRYEMGHGVRSWWRAES